MIERRGRRMASFWSPERSPKGDAPSLVVSCAQRANRSGACPRDRTHRLHSPSETRRGRSPRGCEARFAACGCCLTRVSVAGDSRNSEADSKRCSSDRAPVMQGRLVECAQTSNGGDVASAALSGRERQQRGRLPIGTAIQFAVLPAVQPIADQLNSAVDQNHCRHECAGQDCRIHG